MSTQAGANAMALERAARGAPLPPVLAYAARPDRLPAKETARIRLQGPHTSSNAELVLNVADVHHVTTSR